MDKEAADNGDETTCLSLIGAFVVEMAVAVSNISCLG